MTETSAPPSGSRTSASLPSRPGQPNGGRAAGDSDTISGDRGRPAHADRAASYVFAALVALAVPLYLVLGRHQWFWSDEWDFLVSRNGGSLQDLLRPHNQHWSTLPILEYRTLWHLVGLRSYVPYQLPVILLHLTAAVMLWMVIKRAGVRPWVATLVTSVFVLYGFGHQDIVWGFQVGFDGSLVLGLAHLLLADHDGPFDRRDVAGVVCGVAGLLCSGLAVTMVLVVGVATLLRRGWRVAAMHTVPPAIVYAAWWLTNGRDTFGGSGGSGGQIIDFVVRGVSNALARLGHVPGVGVTIFVMLVVGLALAWGRLSFATFRRRAAAPVALLFGSVAFLTLAGVGRVAALGTSFAGRSRYAHVTLALLLPALAVAVDALMRRRRVVACVVVPLLLVGIPGNLREVGRAELGTPGVVKAMANSRLATVVPRSDVPDRRYALPVTVGWLRDAAASGRLPAASDPSTDDRATATIRLALPQGAGSFRPERCPSLTGSIDRSLARGQAIVWAGGSLSVRLVTKGRASGLAVYLRGQGGTLRARAAITVRLARATATTPPIRLCTT